MLITALLLRKRRFPAGHPGPPEPQSGARDRQPPLRSRARSGVRAAPARQTQRTPRVGIRSQAQQPGRATAAQCLSHGGGLGPPAPRAVRGSCTTSGPESRRHQRGTSPGLARGPAPNARPEKGPAHTCTAPPLGCSCPSPPSWGRCPGSRRQPWRDGSETKALPHGRSSGALRAPPPALL